MRAKGLIIENLLVLIFLFAFIGATKANTNIEEIKKNLPKILGSSNAGTEFYSLLFIPVLNIT